MEFKQFADGYFTAAKTADSLNDYFRQHDVPIIVTKEKELCKHELYAIWWFMQNEFSGKVTVQNTKKTEFLVTKDGVSDTFTLTATNCDPRKCDIQFYMQLFSKSFHMKQELEKLRGDMLSLRRGGDAK